MSNHKINSNVTLNCSVKKHCKPNISQPLLKENFLGEFKTEIEKKKVLDNLGITPTDNLLEWIDVTK